MQHIPNKISQYGNSAIGRVLLIALFAILLSACQSKVLVHDWPSWRGIHQNGYSGETNLVSNWSKEGENLIWRADFTGRSTPIILNGRVYVIGRVGENEAMQERITCFDAETGAIVWDYRYNVRNTSIPYNRIGWASLVGDTETGNVYAVGGGAMLHCFDSDGNILWKRSLIEEFGTRTGYGGRTTNAVIDEDRVVVGFVSAGWGDQKSMRHRHFAFNKHNGELVWTFHPNGPFRMPNIYTVPTVAVVDGMRVLIAGNADGSIYMMKARTGEQIWEFKLSKRGLNSSVLVDGNRVYAAHGEENIDEAQMGRIVSFKPGGSGDITRTNELWRYDAEIGYTSPMIHDGRVYYIDNTASLICLDAATGKRYWDFSLGTVGKSSPVWADGKIYVTETNGHFHILQPGDTSCTRLDTDKINMPDGRYAEIYSSPAVAYGRIYFATEEGVYCIGDKTAKFPKKGVPVRPAPLSEAPGVGPASYLQVYPGEDHGWAGETMAFTARLYDAKGRFIKTTDAQWSLKGLPGSISADGKYLIPNGSRSEGGLVEAKAAGLTGTARLRTYPALPWTEDFESYDDETNPAVWIGTGSKRSPGGKYLVKTIHDNKVLSKPPAQRGIQRHTTFFGPSDMSGYVIQADVMDQKYKRKRGDAALVSHGYTLDMMGKQQRLEIRSWVSEYRIKRTIDFDWKPETWYTMKLVVEQHDDKAVIKGKVWRTDSPEPAEWTIQTEDPYPIRQGSPGITGVSYTELYIDNVKVY